MLDERNASGFEFGYPDICDLCQSLEDPARSLRVKPFFKPGGPFRLMLVGQDPTIEKSPERVNHVLMLDEPGRPLSRWLRGLLAESYDRATLYATNVVKCSFSQPPSKMKVGGLPFLRPYARNCKRYLVQEISRYRPSLVLTLGEPSHVIFREILDNPDAVGATMQDAFTGKFSTVSIEGIEFVYSPCLHIQTFRVAETYGSHVQEFKAGLKKALSST